MAQRFASLADAQQWYDQQGLPLPPDIMSQLTAPAPGGQVGGITPGMILAHISMVRHGLQKEQEASAKEAAARKQAKAQANAPQPLTPFQSLMAMAQGGDSVDLSAYQKALQQSRAQEEQNQSDIADWYGQLSGNIKAAGKANRKTSKKMRREGARFNRSLMGGQADKGVAYALGIGAANEGAYLRDVASEQAMFDRRLANDAIAQGNYQAMVQARLGAQERAGIRDDMRSAAQSAQGEGWDRMMQVLGLMSQDQRDAFLQGQDPRMAGGEGPDYGDLRSALGESADSLFTTVPNEATGKDQETARLTSFPQALAALRGAVTSAGLDLNDPRVRQAYLAWVQGNFANRWNSVVGGPNWALSGSSFRQLQP